MPRRKPKLAVTRLPRASTMLYRSRSGQTNKDSGETHLIEEHSKQNGGQRLQSSGEVVAGTIPVESENVESKESVENAVISCLQRLPIELVRLIERSRLGGDSQCEQGTESSLETLRHDLRKTPHQVCAQLTAIVGDILFSEFEAGSKETVRQLNELLDWLSSLSPKADSFQELCPQDGVSEFYLNPEDIGEPLTLEVDERVVEMHQGASEKEGGTKRKDQSQGQKTIVAAYGSLQWNMRIQNQLCHLLRLGLSSEPADLEKFSFSQNFKEEAQKVRNSGAGQGMQLIGATLEDVCKTLEVGGFLDAEEFMGALGSSCKEAAHIYMTTDNAMVRRGKIMGYADAFINLIAEVLDDIMGVDRATKVRRGTKKRSKAAADDGQYMEGEVEAPKVKLPQSIAFNREPYRHGNWRKTPFKPRPYVRLESYHIVEEFAREEITKKLQTKKTGGCDGDHCKRRDTLGEYSLEKDRFVSLCTCLSRNTECGPSCKCSESNCLNRAVTKRQAVKLGIDVEEIDSWGMDCYTRKNIQDAILESQAFGEYKIPDYGKVQAPCAAAATSAGQHAAVAADAPSPSSTKRSEEQTAPKDNSVHRMASEWIEYTLMPAINRQGPRGWDLNCALESTLALAEAQNDQTSRRAAKAIQERFNEVGSNYFRLHPKGVGLICKRQDGIPPLTFVEEYLGEIHTPWRWFELQDAVKKITGSELPDFYNIVLERPKDDPDGYDVLFVDAAAKGAVASRMSHSCTPNCQAVVMACNGRLTIALYTLRHVHPGEELTFDYSSVTESEKEFREAICLCGTHMCRGSYLYFTGSRAFMQILSKQHNLLHRQVALIRAGMEPLTRADSARLKKFGLGSSCLGSKEDGSRVPPWLEKWASLICEYLENEYVSLKEELYHKDPYKRYTEAAAAAEAKGVVSNRVQNIVITLDKVRMFLKHQSKTEDSYVRVLHESEVVDHLWNGPKSISKRLLRGCAHVLAPKEALTMSDGFKVVDMLSSNFPDAVVSLASMVNERASSAEEARGKLLRLCDVIRQFDLDIGGGLTAAADAGTLYAHTKIWFTCAKHYKNITSPKVPINLEDLFLNRGDTESNLPEERQISSAQSLAKQHSKHPALRKVYRPTYAWGQLSGWFKQTVNDPTASLSAERRGAISLPDIESAFKQGSVNYLDKDRRDMLEQLDNRPDSMWKTGTLWQFRNEAKIYGTPMLDQAWVQVTGKGTDPMPALLSNLRNAKLPRSRRNASTSSDGVPPKNGQRRSRGSNSKNSDIYVIG